MRLLLFLLVALFLISCKQKKIDRVDDYYASLFLPYTNVKVQQQQFLDTIAVALLAVAQDSNVVINTKALRTYLDTLEEACQAGQSILTSVQEMDTSIRYKNKVLEYIAFSNMACKNEFTRALNILEIKTGNRYDSIIAFFKPVVEDLQRKSNACAEASVTFRVKHNVGGSDK